MKRPNTLASQHIIESPASRFSTFASATSSAVRPLPSRLSPRFTCHRFAKLLPPVPRSDDDESRPRPAHRRQRFLRLGAFLLPVHILAADGCVRTLAASTARTKSNRAGKSRSHRGCVSHHGKELIKTRGSVWRFVHLQWRHELLSHEWALSVGWRMLFFEKPAIVSCGSHVRAQLPTSKRNGIAPYLQVSRAKLRPWRKARPPLPAELDIRSSR